MENRLENWEYVPMAANCTIYVLPDSAGKERDFNGSRSTKTRNVLLEHL